jgi:uncharacterized protein (DUF488 family)
MALPSIYTIGVYGWSEKDFFQKLVENKIDLFCDIRRRRGVRGAEYAFANSERLQQSLANLSIRYLHEAGLTPTLEIIRLQDMFDEHHKIQRRKREELGDVFKKTYREKILSQFDFQNFINGLQHENVKRIVLFCVERSAAACHRSLVTNEVKRLYPGTHVINL